MSNSMADPDADGRTHARHPIRVVAARTGLRPDVLRAWERRYEAVTPGRAPKGRRLYSDADIERLLLLKQAVHLGRRISDVANLSTGELEALVREDAGAVARPAAQERMVRRRGSVREYLERALQAAVALDRTRLETLLGEASVALSGAVLRREVIPALLERIGELWREGQLRPIHEHLASATVRGFLATRIAGQPRAGGAPELVIGTPAGHRHEFGALLAAWAAADSGWAVTYLGPDLPAEEMAAAVRQKQARALLLSIVYPAADARTAGELVQLRRLLGPDIAILAGGRAAQSYADVLREIGALQPGDLGELQRELEVLAR
jgi:DNA-binding transcriptional MerR regulator/methylmalonyl-CoA mutase cobalamin-binding subunit